MRRVYAFWLHPRGELRLVPAPWAPRAPREVSATHPSECWQVQLAAGQLALKRRFGSLVASVECGVGFAFGVRLRDNSRPVSPYFTHPLVLSLWSLAIATFAIFCMLTVSNTATYRALAQPALRIYTAFTATGALFTACVVCSFLPMAALLKSHVFRLMWVFAPAGLAFWVWSLVTFTGSRTRWLDALALTFVGVSVVALLDLVLCVLTGRSAMYVLSPERTEAIALLASGNVLRQLPLVNVLGAFTIVLAIVTCVSLFFNLLRARRVDVMLVVGVVFTLVLVCSELGLVLAKSKYTVPLLFFANLLEAMRIAWASRERVFSELQEIRSAQREQAALLEAQLLQLQRNAELAQLGQYTAELSHDIRNPLTTVMGAVDLAESALRSNPPQVNDALDMLTTTRTALDHVLELVRNITRQARESQPSAVPVLLRQVISSAVALCQQQLRQVEVQVELGDEELCTIGHQTQLVQVLVNLLVNAAEAVGHEQTPWIRISAERSEKLIRLRRRRLRQTSARCVVGQDVRVALHDGFERGVYRARTFDLRPDRAPPSRANLHRPQGAQYDRRD